MPTLGGNVVIRNGNQLGYCWRECIKSLLPVCDLVSVSDGESTDGTQEELREWMKSEPKIVLNVYPWPSPRGNPDWFVDWLDYNRQHIQADWQFQLDADEVLHEKSYPAVRAFIEGSQERTGVVTRFNFWKDHKHLIPDGFCCSKRPIRLAPQKLFLASDGYDPRGERAAGFGTATEIEIFHVGFIRPVDRFMEKERLIQGYYFDTFDPRLEQAQKAGNQWASQPGVTGWEDKLDDYSGDYPEVLKPWLQERGFEV